VDAVGAPHVGDRTEKQLITSFCNKIAELSPQLVTFNGNSFDLPVLRYRAMVLGVSAPGLTARPYFHRYTEDAALGARGVYLAAEVRRSVVFALRHRVTEGL